jgi:serine/threonine-protein kinase
LNQAKAASVPGTEGGDGPFFSPDGQWLGFVASGKLLKVLLQGGSPITLCEVPLGFSGASWGRDGSIVGAMGTQTEPATQTGLSRIPDSGGARQPLTRTSNGEATHRWPQFLPGGESVLFTAHTLLDNFDYASLQVVSVKTGKTKTVLRGGYFGRYIPSGHLLYLRDGVLYAVGFDLASLETRGAAKPMLDDIAVSTAWGTGRFDFSQTGLFVYRRPVATSWPIVWMDSSGKVKPLLQTPGPYYSPRLSPDGKKLAVSVGGITRGNISVYDLLRDKMILLTSDGQGHFGPVWTPDGKHLIYRSHHVATGEYAIEWTRVDGSSEPQRLLTSKSSLEPYSLSPDGRHLAYMKGETGYDIWTLPIDMDNPEHPKAGDPEPFSISPANELQPVFSPDGHWIAYVSNESGRSRSLYVRPFPAPKDAPDRKWRISDGGELIRPSVDFPMWSRKGQQLFYLRRPGTIMAVPYSIHGDSFVAERPRVWAQQSILETELFSSLDLSADGKRFAVFPRPDIRDERDAVTRLSVLQNFFDEVRRRVPPGGK